MKTKQNKNKLLLICGCVITCLLLLTGVVQTFVLNSAKNKLNILQGNNSAYETEIKDLTQEEEYKKDPAYSDDILEHEQGYGNEGDKIIETNK